MPLPMWSGMHHTFEVEVSGEIQNSEPTKHEKLVRVKVEPSENELGFQLVIENNIITETEEMLNQFTDLSFYLRNIPQQIGENGGGNVNFLAWTTTPWTLPSNMFLATGADIHYTMVYDFASKEYYILANNLLKKYYKNAEDYLVIRTFKGKELQGLHYEPLFDYITKSFTNRHFERSEKSPSTEIATSSSAPRNDHYLPKFFQILNADFVSIEDGTGIVHIAPTFGVEDFDAVAKLL
jgi:isoleucyl-tRNA synthetase